MGGEGKVRMVGGPARAAGGTGAGSRPGALEEAHVRDDAVGHGGASVSALGG